MKFGKDGDGNYGYYGADGSLIPFKSVPTIEFDMKGTTNASATVVHSSRTQIPWSLLKSYSTLQFKLKESQKKSTWGFGVYLDGTRISNFNKSTDVGALFSINLSEYTEQNEILFGFDLGAGTVTTPIVTVRLA